MNDFDIFLNQSSRPDFKKNQWGNWDYRDQAGRNPFDRSTQSMGVNGGMNYSYGQNGTINGSYRGSTPGAYDWNVPVSQKMSDAMLDATGGRTPVLGPNGSFSAGGPQMGSGPLWNALRRDMGVMQGAEDRFQGESRSRQHDFLNSVLGGSNAMGQASNMQAQMLRKQADMLDGLAGNQNRMLDPLNHEMGSVAAHSYLAGGGPGGTAKMVGKDVDGAVSGYEQEIGAERQRGQEDASAAAYAQARRTESSIAQNIRENGAPTNPAQVEAFISSARKMGADETQQIVSGIQSQARDRVLEMTKTLAALKLQGAGMKAQAAEIDNNRTNSYLGANQQIANNKLQQEQLSMQTRQLATQVRQMNADIWTRAVLDRVRFEAEGRANYAQMLQPESIISWVQGIMGIMGAESAASGQNPQMG